MSLRLRTKRDHHNNSGKQVLVIAAHNQARLQEQWWMAIHGGRRRGEVWRARTGEAEEGMKGKGLVRDLQQERKGIQGRA